MKLTGEGRFGGQIPPNNSEMTKLSKMLLLINLLSHRRSVSLKNIQEVCDIPERTAYRYLRELSESNIPLYYDRFHRGYRLSGAADRNLPDVGPDHTVLVGLALKMLAARLSPDYRNDVENLIQKFCSHQDMPVEQILRPYQQQIEELSTDEDFSNLVTSVLMTAAVVCRWKVRLTSRNSKGEESQPELSEPRLRFDGGWQVVGGEDPTSVRLPLEDIKKVSILQDRATG